MANKMDLVEYSTKKEDITKGNFWMAKDRERVLSCTTIRIDTAAAG